MKAYVDRTPSSAQTPPAHTRVNNDDDDAADAGDDERGGSVSGRAGRVRARSTSSGRRHSGGSAASHDDADVDAEAAPGSTAAAAVPFRGETRYRLVGVVNHTGRVSAFSRLLLLLLSSLFNRI